MLRKTETRESIQLGLFEQEQPDIELSLISAYGRAASGL